MEAKHTPATYAVGIGAQQLGSGRYDWNAPYIYRVNPYAANYDAPGVAVAWMAHNPFSPGSESYEQHRAEMTALARRMADGLNAQECAAIAKAEGR